VLNKVRDSNFVYYAGEESLEQYKDMGISEAVILPLVKQAWDEMVDDWTRESQGKAEDKRSRLPSMMAALWIPQDAMMYYASSTRYGKGSNFGYQDTTPKQVRELLKEADQKAVASGAPSSLHRTKGSCAEVVCAIRYFSKNPERHAHPSPEKGAIIAYGFGNGEEPAIHQKACTGRETEWGCQEFLAAWGVKWFGPHGSGTTHKQRSLNDELAAGESCPALIDDIAVPLNYSGPLTTFQTLLSTGTGSATIQATGGTSSDTSLSSFSTASIPGDDSTISSLSSMITSTTQSPSKVATPTPTGPVDASSILKNCTQVCLAGFKACNEELGSTGSVDHMNCYVVGGCYHIDPPYQSAAPTTGAPINPEDPNAVATARAKAASIDMSKAGDLCKTVRKFPCYYNSVMATAISNHNFSPGLSEYRPRQQCAGRTAELLELGTN
ncbi:MAG: hypothetical protein Q9191_006141, partial [Dirinaria sp. TL-2023a]